VIFGVDLPPFPRVLSTMGLGVSSPLSASLSSVGFRSLLRNQPALPNVTLVAVSSVKMKNTVRALKASMRGLRFGRVVLVSHKLPSGLPRGVEFVRSMELRGTDDYSRFVLYELGPLIHTEFALVVQHDGFVVRPHRWTADFLEYDYVGAPWKPGKFFAPDGSSVLVGNGGFSLRSKRMLDAFNVLQIGFADGGTGSLNEDGLICSLHRNLLEENGLRFAPMEVAARFSLEDSHFSAELRPFGFHSGWKFMPLPSRISYLLRFRTGQLFEHVRGQVLNSRKARLS